MIVKCRYGVYATIGRVIVNDENDYYAQFYLSIREKREGPFVDSLFSCLRKGERAGEDWLKGQRPCGTDEHVPGRHPLWVAACRAKGSMSASRGSSNNPATRWVLGVSIPQFLLVDP